MSWIPSYKKKKPPYVPCSWSDGTDEEIIEALEKHYNNEVNLYDYWSIGDERTINLSAMNKVASLSDKHPAQTVTMVLWNKGGKDLYTPINGHTECAFIVGQKDVLLVDTTQTSILNESGEMHPNNDVNPYWTESARRTWCNANSSSSRGYRYSIPSSIKDIFKRFKNYDIPSKTANDYFAIPSEYELLGSNTCSADESSIHTHFEYFQTSANRNSMKYSYWLRSRCNTLSGYNYVCMGQSVTNGNVVYFVTGDAQTVKQGILPFGVI